MRDIPMFTTQSGVASIYLKNVPSTKTAYIRFRDTRDPDHLLKDCVDFCRSAGANHIFAAGHDYFHTYELASSLLLMKRDNSFPETDASIFPVQKETMEQWRKIYNEKMRSVQNAAQISYHEAKKYLDRGACYYVHKDHTLLGIGVASGGRIDAVASVVPGAGRDVLIALSKALSEETIEIIVSDSNNKAIRLYQSLDFIVTEVVEKWYKII